MGKSLLVFGLERAELRPGRKQEGWDGGVLCSASCPPLIFAFDLSLSSHWCFGSAQPCSVCRSAPRDGQEREEHCCCPAEAEMGLQPLLVPSCPPEEELTCWTGAVEERLCGSQLQVCHGKVKAAGIWHKQDTGLVSLLPGSKP